MEKKLLFSENKELFRITKKLIGKNKLKWCTYKCLDENMYLQANIVIMHFDEKMLKTGTYESIIKVKEKLVLSLMHRL